MKMFGMNFMVFFILLNLVNVVIQTTKSLFTINGDKWSAAFINGVTYFIYTFVIFYTAVDGLSILDKALIVGGCNLIGVFVVKWAEERLQKDKLWIYTCTAKEDLENTKAIFKMLKDLGIKSVYNEVVKDELYSMTIFSNTQKESQMIKSVLENFNVKYCATETKDATPKDKKKNSAVE